MDKLLQKVIKNYKQLQKTSPILLNKCKPVIISDIDGVLLRGTDPIPGVYQAVKKIHRLEIPFACLTNGGGQTEKAKTKKMNQSFKQQLFHAESMFMNHTPLKPQVIKFSKKEGILLITGSRDVLSILKELNINNFVTTDEIFWFVNPNIHKRNILNNSNHVNLDNYPHLSAQMQLRVSKRLKRPVETIPVTYQAWSQQLNSIFALNDVSPYQTTLQCIHNIFSARKSLNLPSLIYYAAQNDIVWASQYPKPRMAFGPFNRILANHCKVHGFELSQTVFGKPTLRAFSYVEEAMKKQHSNGVLFFMIGDNPHSDIRGANNIGWESFLTRTGIHQSEQNDKEDPATFVVDNFAQAIDVITDLDRKIASL